MFLSIFLVRMVCSVVGMDGQNICTYCIRWVRGTRKYLEKEIYISKSGSFLTKLDPSVVC